MFLDEELENTYNDLVSSNPLSDVAVELLGVCLRRMPKPEEVSSVEFLNKLKTMEGGWKLFCKKHPEFNPNGIMDFVCKNQDISEPVKKYMRWE